MTQRPTMRVAISTHTVAKAGNSATENEDAFYPLGKTKRQGRSLRFAIADGATESSLSGEWAQILCSQFGRDRSSRALRVIENAQHEWESWMAHYLQQRELDNKPLQWFEEPGIERGAFAALLTIVMATELEGDERSGVFRAAAIGDCCLFQVRADTLIAKFPMSRAEDFNSSPFLVASNPLTASAELKDELKLSQGTWQRGDMFYLMTDAISAWFLQRTTGRGKPWRKLDDFGTERELKTFENWIQELRHGKKVKNDDSTLVRITVH